ncbi:MAG TPA: glycosyltransferase family 4 protein [Pyrinomonadaceae bacterium]|nr:glycosyltransferase family 4 protein [Pyrinomonadaceae bacterium]
MSAAKTANNRENRERRLKVLHLIEGLGSGGAERLLYTNLKHFDRESLENEVVTVFSGADYWRQPILDLNVPVSTLDCRSLRDIVPGVRRLRKEIARVQPDLIHTHLWTANIIGRIAGFSTKTPVLSSIHNPEYEPEVFIDAPQLNPKKLFVARSLDKWTARVACRKMLAVSHYVKESASRRLDFPPEKIEVLYNPIDVSDLCSGTVRTREMLLNELNLPARSFILLNVARVAPQKGLLYAIQALAEIRRRFPETHLISVGGKDDAAWLARLEAEIERLGLKTCVHLLGARRDVRDFLHNCDLFVFPSVFEGLGIALTEAMAVGCACAASRIRPLDEFVETGVDGMLFPPKEAAALAETAIDLLENREKRRTIGEAARKKALSLFQPQPAADKLTDIYFSMV